MSTLWIREYQKLATVSADSAGSLHGSPLPQEPGIDQTPVTFSASAAQSAAFAPATAWADIVEGGTNLPTRYIAMIADTAFCYKIGANPTATTNHLKIPANALVFVGVQPGMKVSVVNAP